MEQARTMNKKSGFTRRRFLGAAVGTVAVPFVVPSSILGLRGAVPPSEKIVMGVIGLGGMGNGNLSAFMGKDGTQVIAVCDADQEHLDKTAVEVDKRYGNKDCKRLRDFRELLAQKDLNAVVVATPDHWHAICAIAAVRSGRDVYCEKPVTHTFAEGQALVAAVKEKSAILQVGSQQRSDWKFRRGVDLVLNGLIGKVKSVAVGLPSGNKNPPALKTQDPPAHIDYDYWCGPSTKHPYSPDRLHWNWRWHLSYGGGQLMDWIGHHNDISHWGLDVDQSGPVEVKAVDFEYPADRSLWDSAWKYEILCKYASGAESSISSKNPMGCKWTGDAGWVFVDRGKLEASNPEWVKREFDPGQKKAYESNDHRANFLESVKSRKPTICPAETGHRSITPGHLGLVSQALGGRTLRWDPKTETVIGDAEADKLLKAVNFRKPWAL